MSNFSNIGFVINSKQELEKLLGELLGECTTVDAKNGTYFVYSDSSGAEMWMQQDLKRTFTGFNPHFHGKSRRKVGIVEEIKTPTNELDGSYYCWADPKDDTTNTGDYPFIFEAPDFDSLESLEINKCYDIQLSAFAHTLEVFDTEEQYKASQKGEVKFASKSFIPSGLFTPDMKKDTKEARGIFTGIIKEAELKKNSHTQESFYWMLVDTLGGEVDIVADKRFLQKTPSIGGVVSGHFWLSGRILDIPRVKRIKKGFFQKLFGG